MNIFRHIGSWLKGMTRAMAREFHMVFTDVGVMIFFFALPIAYPIVYAAIYNPEVSREMPVAVVDNCRTAMTREFVRHADATEAITICGYAADIEEARRWMAQKRCYGILEIPADYNRKVIRGEQGTINFYAEVSLLLRYRTFLQSLTDLQMATDADIRTNGMNLLGLEALMSQGGQSIGVDARFLGDTQQGFASFIMPGIVVLILQQSMILGICMLAGTSNDRRRRNGGIDPMAVKAPTSAIIIGKALCYTTIYLPLALYILHYIPVMFHFPHQGNILMYMAFILPLLLASAMMGQALKAFCSERESAFIVVVFTSIIFLFLSGITWPRFAMSPLMKALSDLVPGTWGLEGFVNINTNGATLTQVAHKYAMLWILTGVWFVAAWLVARFGRIDTGSLAQATPLKGDKGEHHKA